ncbi:hypothetical protein Nepgr_030884 [Nepenthes gracilis]|uniref:Uncharacterized protein n=1 Tax=Nepenthes gracilis TaxID=150966 RepID=A0AAD3Y710_NEPGR|nr:hypothetical protein Nepgr_030884 [Nepenthes gracilis]
MRLMIYDGMNYDISVAALGVLKELVHPVVELFWSLVDLPMLLSDAVLEVGQMQFFLVICRLLLDWELVKFRTAVDMLVSARLWLRPNCRSGFMSRFGIQNELPISNCIPYAVLDCCSFRLHQLPIATGCFIPVLELNCRSRTLIGFGLPVFYCQWYAVLMPLGVLKFIVMTLCFADA